MINYEVRLATLSEVRGFIEKNHYSGSVNGLRVSHCFGLYDGNMMVGAMVYGPLGMANAWKKYGSKETEVVELRRLCCIDDTPRNTESYFIGKTIRYLRKNTDFKVVVSYADPTYGHSGVIYRASNFQFVGKSAKGKVIVCDDGRRFHDKSVRAYYINKHGEKVLKPFAEQLRGKLQNGTAKYEATEGKNIYVFRLER